MRQQLPQPTTCPFCGTSAAEAVCHTCKEERPAYTALKNLTKQQEKRCPLDWLRRLCTEAI